MHSCLNGLPFQDIKTGTNGADLSRKTAPPFEDVSELGNNKLPSTGYILST